MRALAVALLLAGLALAGYAFFAASRVESVREAAPAVSPVDPAETAAQRQAAAGTYTTGGKPGDRTIVIGADGRVTFSELGARARIDHGTDTFSLARREKKLCLVTAHSGVIDIVNIETVVYFHDTYQRTR